ncbi:hypothetical protein ACHQM5_021200 [Ranunculus cassubicifolius]
MMDDRHVPNVLEWYLKISACNIDILWQKKISKVVENFAHVFLLLITWLIQPSKEMLNGRIACRTSGRVKVCLV